MTPKSDSDLEKNKSFGLSFKGLFGKFKHKKCKNNDGDLTFDAVPDFPKPAGDSQVKPNHNERDPFIYFNSNKTSEQIENATGKNSFKQSNDNVNRPNKFKEEDNCYEKKQDSLPREDEGKEKDFQSSFKFKETPSILNQTSVVVNGGVGIHFGNVFNNVNNVHYNGSSFNGEQIHKVEKTEAIKALLKCGSKVETGHLQLVSSHFGDKWQDIGVALGLTIGELDCIKYQKKNLQERAFQMLMSWLQKSGERATVGDLCKQLWRSRVDTARESVRQLSLNIELFQ